MYVDFKSQQTTQQMYFLLDEGFTMLLKKCVLQDVGWGTPAYGTFIQCSVAMWMMGTQLLVSGVSFMPHYLRET